MQQRPQDLRSHRTQPMFPEKGAATAAIGTRSFHDHFPTPPASKVSKRSSRKQHALPGLLFAGLLLALIYLALYPLFAGPTANHDSVRQELTNLLPWQPALFWTTAFPGFVTLLAHVPWLNPLAPGTSYANLLLILLVLAWLLNLLAVRIGKQAVQSWLSPRNERFFFWSIMLLTALFGLIMLFAPVVNNAMSRDMLLYAFYGRMVVFYHINPFAVLPSVFPRDQLYTILTASPNTGAIVPLPSAMAYGPVWLDCSLLVTLFARQNIAYTLLGFRLIGLVAHLTNILLLWAILTKIKPEARIPAILLYAWNPLILVLGISQMHLDIVLVLFLLLAILFFQRDSLLLCWVFTLLAVLVNVLFLPLLPLCLHLINQKLRFIHPGFRLLWCLGMLMISALILVLSYAPYWDHWGLEGLRVALAQTFWLQSAVNSLDAALLKLPMQLPAPVLEIVTPSRWAVGVLIIAGCFLLFSLWLANTLELVLFCGSWLLLILLLLLPTYWPWYLIVPLTLALCATNRGTTLLTILLSLGALLCYYWWQLPTVWQGQALSTIGLPLLLWGWIEFFVSTWRMTRPTLPPEQKKQRGISKFNFARNSRPSWFSRPSWPSRPQRRL
jgi:hypothetical protein